MKNIKKYVIFVIIYNCITKKQIHLKVIPDYQPITYDQNNNRHVSNGLHCVFK